MTILSKPVNRYYRLVACAALCAFMSLAVSAQEPDPRKCDVGDDPNKFGCLYKSLGNYTFKVREKATKELLRRAGTPGGLKPDEVAALQRAFVDRDEPDLEIRWRARLVFDKFVDRFPSVTTISFHLRVQVNPTTGDFTLGQATGRYDPKIKADKDKVTELQKHWRALQDALAAGNANNASTAYDNLFRVLKSLGNADFTRLKLMRGGQPFTRENLAQMIFLYDVDQAFGKLEDEHRNAGANPAPPPKDKAPVDMSGRVDLGLTVGLVAATIVSPGSLDFSLEDAQDPLSLPPPGWHFVGEAFHLEADEELRIAGPILISIVFGEELLLGDPIIDPEMLKVVRIADGEASFLEIVSIDLENSVLYARYEVDAEDPEADQFGQFAIAYPVPIEEENTALRVGDPATAAAVLATAAHASELTNPGLLAAADFAVGALAPKECKGVPFVVNLEQTYDERAPKTLGLGGTIDIAQVPSKAKNWIWDYIVTVTNIRESRPLITGQRGEVTSEVAFTATDLKNEAGPWTFNFRRDEKWFPRSDEPGALTWEGDLPSLIDDCKTQVSGKATGSAKFNLPVRNTQALNPGTEFVTVYYDGEWYVNGKPKAP